MNEILRIAAFTGDRNAETAISERLGYTGDIIEELGLALPDGGTPPDDWPCAIFTPEAGMHGFSLRCESNGLLDGEPTCRQYGLPDGVGHAVFMGLRGDQAEIDGFCQAVCDLSGMAGHVVRDADDGYRFEKTLAPSGGPGPADGFFDLLADLNRKETKKVLAVVRKYHGDTEKINQGHLFFKKLIKQVKKLGPAKAQTQDVF